MRQIKYVMILLLLSAVLQTNLNVLFAENPESPIWLGDTTYDDYGNQDRVLQPWTPVQTDGDNTFSVWGRSFVWANGSILPSQILSQDVNLLASPMKLIMTIGGVDYEVPLGTLTIVESKMSRITFVAQGQAADVSVQADMWLEYDGFLWVELSITDGQAGRSIENLRVVTTFETENATLYQTFSRAYAGWVGDQSIQIPWMSDEAANIINFYHWLGNEDRGLGFTFTSLENCSLVSEENFATITPASELTVYQINLVETPTIMQQWTYRFGIQATPIKPLPPDYHSMMAGNVSYKTFSLLQNMPENFDMVTVWPEPVTTIQLGLNNPYNVDAAQMQNVVTYWHDKGVGINTVAACPQKMCDYDEWFNDYFADWTTIPESSLDWNGHLNYQNCAKSYSLRKWLFYGWASENVDKFQTEGIYWDGWQGGQIACSNPNHGCGWSDGQGARYSTVPVLEGREFNQRMCMFLEDNVQSNYYLPQTAPQRTGFPQYHLWIHSWEFVPSVMGFATEWLTGEFAAYPISGVSMLEPEGTYGKCLGLGMMRARCLSTNWGVPNYFHATMWEHEEFSPDTQTLQAYAWFLPHGVPIAAIGHMNHLVTKEMTQIMMDFEARKSEFTPGWRENSHIEIESPIESEVMVATWEHPDKNKILVVVSNLNVAETRVVQLRWKGFPNPKITNARTGDVISADGTIEVLLGPESFILMQAQASSIPGDYVVVGYQNSELLQFDGSGGYVGQFTGDGAVASGTSLAIDPSNRIYYGNASGVISRFDKEGGWDHWYQQRSSGQIYGLVAGADAVFASDAGNNAVLMYDPNLSANGGTVLGSGSHEILNPQGMCQDETGRIYLANRGNGNVLRWHADGTFDSEIIPVSGAPNCVDVAIDEDGYLWVLRVMARQLSYLVRFTQDGTYAGVIRTLDAASGIEYPNHFYITPYGRTMVSASTGVHEYDEVSVSWSTFISVGSGGLNAPYGIVRKVDVEVLFAGDANGDGMVDVGDLGILAANYGGADKHWTEGDFNGDGMVDVGDLGILAANYGQGTSGEVDFDIDYAKAFDETITDDEADDIEDSVCGVLGLPLIAGVFLVGLLLVKLDD